MRNICCVLASYYFRPQGVVSRVEVKIVFESTIYHLWAIALLSSPLNMFVNSYLQHLSWSILIINVSPSLYCITPSKPADTLSRETLQIFLKTSLTSQQQVSQDEKAENRIKLGLRTHVLWRKTLINSLQVWNRCEFWHNSK